ncbi:MAG: hypothetical protein JWM21_939 [Acidobacteria bacterium]|nr:hypothetical protein [Acidobacteriota bacterium]
MTVTSSTVLTKLSLAVLCVLFLAAQSTEGQDTVTGAFWGTVTDSQTGAPLKGAVVEIINLQTEVAINPPLLSDYLGRFFQGLLIPGEYRVRVSMPGYQTHEVRQLLRITVTGEVVPVPVALDQVSPVVPTTTPTPAVTLGIEDTDIRAGMNRVDGHRSGSFSHEEVTTLPLSSHSSRSFDELALLLPGVAPPPQTLGNVAGPGVGAGVGSAGQFSVNGLRSRANNFTVDGSDNNDEDIGVRRQGFVALIAQPMESIQEYQTITLLAPAQFGRNIGGQVNAVSRSGGNQIHGTAYAFFNSSHLNARNFFDTTFGNAVTPLTAAGKPVLFDGRPGSVRNQSDGQDSLTLVNGGMVLGGPLKRATPAKSGTSVFYFISAEGQLINASKEASFAVPTVEQRGLFNSGATGLSVDPFTGQPAISFPATISGEAIFSLYPFPNNPNGIYGANTFTQSLPAGERGMVFSGKVDANFRYKQRQQGVASRYNFTNDWRDIPVTGGALFSTLRPRVRTQNLSNFLNSEISAPGSSRQVFNQVRASYGRTRLVFDERRDNQFLRPSKLSAGSNKDDGTFLLNAPLRVNDTVPGSNSVPYANFFNFNTEDILGPLGQVTIAGFSPAGVDVFNFPQRRVNNTYQLADALTVRVGSHNFGLGGDVRRSELNSQLPVNARPLITFNGGPKLSLDAQGNVTFQTFVQPIDLVAASAPSGVLQAVTRGSGSGINLRYYQYNFYWQDQWRVKPNLSLSFGVRYEYNTPPRESNRRIENTFNDPSLDLVPGFRGFLGGRTSIFNPDHNNIGPRLGIAYSPNLFGRSLATVFRAGYGLFYDQAIGAVVSQSRNVFPNFLTLNLAGGLPSASGVGFRITDPSLPFFPCRDSNGTVQFLALTQPGTLNRLNPDVSLQCLVAINTAFPGGFGFTLPSRSFQMPAAHHYAFTFEQQLRQNLVVSVAYVGTLGRHLLRLTTPNLGPNAFLIPTVINVVNFQPNVSGRAIGPGQSLDPSGAIVGGRPVSQAGSVNIYESSANSRYDSLQVQLRGRLPQAAHYQLSYTWSRVTDDVSDVFDLAGAPALPQDSLSFAGERGPANFDARHRLSYNLTYALPSFKTRRKAVRWLVGKLELAGIGRFQTGQPFTVNSIFDVNLDGNLTDRLDTTMGLVVTGDRRQPIIVTASDPRSLLAAIGQDGRIGRNTFRSGNLLDLDLSLAKHFSLAAQRKLTLRVDIFNFINRANFGIPVRYLGAAGFGRATDTVTPARRVQLALKYSL